MWEKLAREVMGEPDTDWLMIDSSCIKVHADGCGAHKRGLNTKLHLAIDKAGKPVRMILSAGQTADCSFAMDLAAGLPLRVLFADKGYDVNCLVDTALAGDTQVVIPPKKNRKVQRAYDKELYKERHLLRMSSAGSSSGAALPRALLNGLTLSSPLAISGVSFSSLDDTP